MRYTIGFPKAPALRTLDVLLASLGFEEDRSIKVEGPYTKIYARKVRDGIAPANFFYLDHRDQDTLELPSTPETLVAGGILIVYSEELDQQTPARALEEVLHAYVQQG